MDHVVFAVIIDNTRVRVSDPANWNHAQYQWRKLDEVERQGLFPHVRYFCVRSVDDPQWADARFDLTASKPVLNTRGFSKLEDAARAAWKNFAPTYSPRKRWHQGIQGLGGWYYYPNGTTAAQGLYHLSQVVKRRNLVVQGLNGRWYVLNQNIDVLDKAA